MVFFFFFFNDTATTEIYTLSLHDALPILKGMVHLIEALAKVRTERDADLVLAGKGATSPGIAAAARKYAVEDAVHVAGRVENLELGDLYARALVAVVPSLYKVFSVPAVPV